MIGDQKQNGTMLAARCEVGFVPFLFDKGTLIVAAELVRMDAKVVLAGMIIILTIFAMSHVIVEIPHTNWIESVLVWISTGMPTGSGKISV